MSEKISELQGMARARKALAGAPASENWRGMQYSTSRVGGTCLENTYSSEVQLFIQFNPPFCVHELVPVDKEFAAWLCASDGLLLCSFWGCCLARGCVVSNVSWLKIKRVDFHSWGEPCEGVSLMYRLSCTLIIAGKTQRRFQPLRSLATMISEERFHTCRFLGLQMLYCRYL